ncbi:hypothetical protein JCM8202_002024 [Rhodotorula sphaerocarpa]
MASTSRWTLDYSPSTAASKVKVAVPPGYTPQAASAKSPARSTSSVSKSASSSSPAVKAGVDLDELRQQKAWELATSPAKALPMQAFMMYMSGSGIQIFSIMSVWFLLKQAVGGAMGVQQAFAGFDAAIKPKAKVPAAADTEDSLPPSFLEQKIVYVVCQVGLLAVALWKLRSMGLLPDSAEDWAPIFGSWVVPPAAAAAAVTPPPAGVPPLGISISG